MHISNKIGGLQPSSTPVTPLFWRSCTIHRRNSFVSKILQIGRSLTHLFARLCDLDMGEGGSAFPHRWPHHTHGHQTPNCGDPSTLEIILTPLPAANRRRKVCWSRRRIDEEKACKQWGRNSVGQRCSW